MPPDQGPALSGYSGHHTIRVKSYARRLAELEGPFTNGRTLVANSMFEECSSLNLPGSTWMGPFRLRVVLLPQAMAGKAANSPPVSGRLQMGFDPDCAF